MEDIIEGELFRRNYMKSSIRHLDSERARFRLKTLYNQLLSSQDFQISGSIERELGIEFVNAEWFFKKRDIADCLSAITICLRLAPNRDFFLKQIEAVFAQEHLRYRVDSRGGVHYSVDEQFELAIAATIEGLGAPRFRNAKQAFEVTLESLSPSNQSGKGLIRGVFEAVESVFLVVIDGKSDRLNGMAVDKHLKPLLISKYGDFPEVEDKVSRTIATLLAWVKDAHPYRHGAAFEDIHEAPLDLVILSASTGIGLIRFLAKLSDATLIRP